LIEQLLSDFEIVGQGYLEEAADPTCEFVGGVARWEAPCGVYDFLDGWDGALAWEGYVGWGGVRRRQTPSVESMAWKASVSRRPQGLRVREKKGELYSLEAPLIEG
jgi:hypothetical protein